MARDLNGDGDVDDANERVTYQYAADRRCLLRAQGDAPPQPLLDDLDDDGLRLHLSRRRRRAAAGGGELDADQRARRPPRRVAAHRRPTIVTVDPDCRAEQTRLRRCAMSSRRRATA